MELLRHLQNSLQDSHDDSEKLAYKASKRSNKVEQAFFVSERDKGDYNNLHVHMLIGTNTDMTYQEVKYGMGNVSVGDYQPIYDSEAVCKYVTKHIGKDVDYDIVFKS